MISLKGPAELAKMRAAGHVVAQVLAEINRRIAPGIRTIEIDAIAADILKKSGATSPFLHYPHHEGGPPYPASTCSSVNEELVHGIPGKRALKEGDIVSVDAGALLDGWVGDTAWTFGVGQIAPQAQRLLGVTRDALYAGIAAAQAGKRMGDIGSAVEGYVKSHGFSVIRDYVGHGVGRRMHEEPEVPNFGTVGRGVRLREGMTFALEPMVSAGAPGTRELGDRWTVAMADGSLCAQFEHTIAIHNGTAEILTI